MVNIAKPIRWSILLLGIALLCFAPSARAGTVAVQDSAHIFGPGDADALRAVAAHAPFDVRVATTTAYADQPSLSRFTRSLVNEPDMIAIAIDPEHRHVQVHFSTDSGIPAAQWTGIERAGNDAFKRGAWEQGSADIIRAAEGAVTPGASSGASRGSPATSSGGHSFLWVLFLLVPLIGLVLFIVVIVALVRRFQRPNNTWTPGNQGPYGGGPYGGGGQYYGPGYGGGQSGGLGPVGGGLIGAGLGGVAGYELGKMEGEREQRERDQGGSFGGDYGGNYSGDSDASSNYDAGGGGSSWDSGSSGDSGGGSDFGGGGGDFGGGDSGGGGDSF